MKTVYSLILSSLVLISSGTYASTTVGHIGVSARVTCNCNVNGVIVPISDSACLPTCKVLQKTNDTQGVFVAQNGDTKTVIY